MPPFFQLSCIMTRLFLSNHYISWSLLVICRFRPHNRHALICPSVSHFLSTRFDSRLFTSVFLCTNPYHLTTVESHCSSFAAAKVEVMKWTLIMFDYNLIWLPGGNTKVNARLMYLQTPLEGKTSDGRPVGTKHKLRLFPFIFSLNCNRRGLRWQSISSTNNKIASYVESKLSKTLPLISISRVW